MRGSSWTEKGKGMERNGEGTGKGLGEDEAKKPHPLHP